MSDPNIIQITQSDVSVTRSLDISTFNTDELTEGSSNLYYTAERVDDRVAALLIDSTTSGIDISYDDSSGELTLSVDLTEVEDSLEDIVDGLITAGTGITATEKIWFDIAKNKEKLNQTALSPVNDSIKELSFRKNTSNQLKN